MGGVAGQATVSALFAEYSRHTPVGRMGEDGEWRAREGVALTLQAAADVLTSRDIEMVTTFLMGRALVGGRGGRGREREREGCQWGSRPSPPCLAG